MHITIDKMETLRYLGYKGGTVPSDIGQMIDDCIKETEKTVVPRTVFKILNADEITLQGNDIARHLQDCEQCILIAATLGMEIDFLIRRAQVTDMSRAIILDACGNSAIETVCDLLEDEIRNKWAQKGMCVTGRFSPGYGDMPITQVAEFCRVLDTQRKIGLYVNESSTMIPTKSVTAVIGVSKNNLLTQKKDCNICNLYETCAFRKEGRTCGKSGDKYGN